MADCQGEIEVLCFSHSQNGFWGAKQRAFIVISPPIWMCFDAGLLLLCLALVEVPCATELDPLTQGQGVGGARCTTYMLHPQTL